MTYLNKEILQDIEDRVELLHKKFKEKFDITETNLRSFKVGDYFGNQKLYLNFPSYIIFIEEYVEANIIETNGEERIYYINRTGSINPSEIVLNCFNSFNEKQDVYLYQHFPYAMGLNRTRFIIPGNSKVTNINKTDEEIYNSIKIKDDRYKLLAYNKKKWIDNEFPYMQDINNIEEGINDIAEFFYYPTGYKYKPWILTTTLNNIDTSEDDYGLVQKPITEDDFTRWKKNIDLLEKAFDDIINIWNLISYINWNEENQFEWEDR